MKMIIGGACQGKKEYAAAQFPDIRWLDGAVCEPEDIFGCQGLYHFEEYLRCRLASSEDLQGFAEELTDRNPGIVLVCSEVGYGVVPVDPFDRLYRETVGRVCTRLAAFSEKVVRVVCGMGMVIKGD